MLCSSSSSSSPLVRLFSDYLISCHRLCDSWVSRQLAHSFLQLDRSVQHLLVSAVQLPPQGLRFNFGPVTLVSAYYSDKYNTRGIPLIVCSVITSIGYIMYLCECKTLHLDAWCVVTNAYILHSIARQVYAIWLAFLHCFWIVSDGTSGCWLGSQQLGASLQTRDEYRSRFRRFQLCESCPTSLTCLACSL